MTVSTSSDVSRDLCCPRALAPQTRRLSTPRGFEDRRASSWQLQPAARIRRRCERTQRVQSSGYHPLSTVDDERLTAASAPSSSSRRTVVDGAAVVHVGAQGGGAGHCAARRCRVLRCRHHAIVSRRLCGLVRAGRGRRRRVRPGHRHRKLGAAHPGRSRGPGPSGVRGASRQGRGGRRPRRTAPPRGPRLHRHRTVRLDSLAHGDRAAGA